MNLEWNVRFHSDKFSSSLIIPIIKFYLTDIIVLISKCYVRHVSFVAFVVVVVFVIVVIVVVVGEGERKA